MRRLKKSDHHAILQARIACHKTDGFSGKTAISAELQAKSAERRFSFLRFQKGREFESFVNHTHWTIARKTHNDSIGYLFDNHSRPLNRIAGRKIEASTHCLAKCPITHNIIVIKRMNIRGSGGGWFATDGMSLVPFIPLGSLRRIRACLRSRRNLIVADPKVSGSGFRRLEGL